MKALFSKLLSKKALFCVLVALFSVVLLVSAGFLTDYIIDSVKQKQQFDKLAGIVQEEAGADGVNYAYVIHPETGHTVKILAEYATLFTMNPDLVGWIKVDNTVINYPVMQTPGWQNYYLQRDFYEQYSKHGTIYVRETADIKEPSDNLTIYGHRMNDGTMFSDLLKYKDQDFFQQNPTITFNTIYEHHDYQIISVFIVDTTDIDYFPYYTYVDGDAKQFNNYVAQCKALSLYDTGVTAADGDKLITLSTCDDDIQTGRVVVVAKQIK